MLQVPLIVMFAVVLNGVITDAGSNCNGNCDDSSIVSYTCTDNSRCVELVRRSNVIAVFARDDTYCYREVTPVFSAHIENISAWVHNETLSVNISWQWPPVGLADYKRGYEATWGLQYVITVPGEDQSACYSVSLSKNDVQQGMLNIPCMKFKGGGFPQTLEFTVTSLAFVIEKLGYSSSFTPSRLQEITVKADNSQNASIPIWNPEISYELSDHVLTVSFFPAPLSFGHTSYEVRIFKAEESKCSPSGPYIDKVDTMPQWPTTSVNFSTENYEECSKYCIGVHPVKNSSQANCSDGCVEEMNDMLLLQVPSHLLKCSDWNVDFVVDMDPYQNMIIVSFKVHPEYDFCFQKFRMILFRPTKSMCIYPGTELKSKIVPWNSSESIVTFEEIAPGNYCVRVEPYHKVCQTKNRNICSVRFTSVHELAEPHPPAASSIQTPEFPVFNQALMISVLTVVGVIILATVGGILWRKFRHRPDVKIDKNITSSGENGELLEEQFPNAQRKVVVLYTHDQPTMDAARALSNFFIHCRGYQVFLDEDHMAQISTGHPSFIPEILAFSCPQNTECRNYSDTKRIIVVKSKRAAQLFKKQEIIMKGIINSNSVNHNTSRFDSASVDLNLDSDENVSSVKEPSNIYNRLDKLFFCPAVATIPTLTDSLLDTCHIFVVQFGDAEVPESETFKRLTPGHRYCLPRHLGELCLNLDRIDHPTDPIIRSRRINEMLQQWKEHKSYKELTEVCG